MRGELVQNFNTLPESRIFISTDAGSTGLNLQVASIIINLDLPWNPAVLEQRIARIYRLGQQNPVQILNLVSKESIEEGMIGKLKFKTSMFEGVLDGGDDMVFINEDKFKQFMDDVDSVIRETPEPVPAVEYVDEEESEEQISEANEQSTRNTSVLSEDETAKEQPESNTSNVSPSGNSSSWESPAAPVHLEDGIPTSTPSTDHTTPSSPCNPKQLITEGVSFFSGLAETLKSPEATQQLIDNIVEVNPETGETNLKIPVSSKETVANVLQLFSKLFG